MLTGRPEPRRVRRVPKQSGDRIIIYYKQKGTIKMNSMKLRNRMFAMLIMVATLAFASLTAFAATTAISADPPVENQVARKVRKELVTLPWTGVFDNLAYKVEGSTVTLYGQVVRPTTRSGAESRVKRIEGVERVINNIEVLPLSPFDDRLRQRA